VDNSCHLAKADEADVPVARRAAEFSFHIWEPLLRIRGVMMVVAGLALAKERASLLHFLQPRSSLHFLTVLNHRRVMRRQTESVMFLDPGEDFGKDGRLTNTVIRLRGGVRTGSFRDASQLTPDRGCLAAMV